MENGDKAHITAIAVDSQHRRMGIAEKLISMFERNSIGLSAKNVDLYVRKKNKPAIGLYKKKGYFTINVLEGYYCGNDPEDAYEMLKQL